MRAKKLGREEVEKNFFDGQGFFHVFFWAGVISGVEGGGRISFFWGGGEGGQQYF